MKVLNLLAPKRLPRTLSYLNLLYLGALPALATFAVLREYGSPFIFLIFLAGIAAVAIYTAVLFSYARVSRRIGVAAFALLDGPVLSLLSMPRPTIAFSSAIQAFLIDGMAIWIALCALAMTSDLPSPDQRRGSVFFAVVSILAFLALFWPYLRDTYSGEWLRLGVLLFGVGEAIYVNYWLLEEDTIVRESEMYVVGYIFLWLIALGAGMAMHEAMA